MNSHCLSQKHSGAFTTYLTMPFGVKPAFGPSVDGPTLKACVEYWIKLFTFSQFDSYQQWLQLLLQRHLSRLWKRRQNLQVGLRVETDSLLQERRHFGYALPRRVPDRNGEVNRWECAKIWYAEKELQTDSCEKYSFQNDDTHASWTKIIGGKLPQPDNIIGGGQIPT